jgi:hypothetical protein
LHLVGEGAFIALCRFFIFIRSRLLCVMAESGLLSVGGVASVLGGFGICWCGVSVLSSVS